MTDIPRLIDANQRRWDAMKFSTSRIPEIDQVSRELLKHKDQYIEISDEIFRQTGKLVPWAVIAVVDQREHSANLGLANSYLGNGQRLDRPTTIIPKNRGPFLRHDTDTPLRGPFFRGALDALLDVQKIQNWDDWSPGGALTFLEGLNGYGYANGPKGNPPMASPYIWGATSEQERGKYVSDGVFNSSVWDSQLGCAAMLRYMSGLDPSVGYSVGEPPDEPQEDLVVTITIEVPKGVKVNIKEV